MFTPYARTGHRPEEMPIWARLQLASHGVPFRKATHYIQSRDGRTIGVAVDGKPVRLVKD